MIAKRWIVLGLVLLPAIAMATPKKKKPKPKPAPTKPEPAPEPAPEPEIEMTPEPARVPDPEPPAVEVKAKVEVPVKLAPKRKRFYVRAGVAHVQPFAQSNELELADVDGAASLAIQNGPIAGSGSTVSSATVPAITVGYVLPFGRDRLSLETVLGIPFTVKFQATGTIRDMSIAPMALGIPTGVPPLGPELGEAKAAPPMITAVYDMLGRGPARPYLGAGVAVLIALSAKITNPILTEVSQPDFKLDPAPGLVLQSGIDIKLANHVYARIDLKFIAFMEARARVEHIQVRTPELPVFDTVEVGTAKMNVWVNPLIIQAGVGTDF